MRSAPRPRNTWGGYLPSQRSPWALGETSIIHFPAFCSAALYGSPRIARVLKITAADVGAWALCAMAFAFGAWGLHVGWRNGILDVHPWRQTHTAISAYEMAVRHGPFWTYRTPIFGPPWQWPLELPVYQWLAAAATRLLPLDLERSGRVVSIGFYTAAFLPWLVSLELFVI